MRLIDADEYEKRIKPYDTEDDMDKALYNFAHYHLVTTPSAQPEPQWIPCSFAMPRGQDEVVVSCHDDSGDTPFDYVSWGFTTTDGEYWIVDNEINNYVVAWMPLPPSYKGDKA